MAKPVNQKGPKNADKEQKQRNRAERDKKRAAAVEAKTKARKEAEEKGLPWNDTIVAARFLEDYDAAFMSAVAGSPKVDDEPVVSPTREELEAIAKGPTQKEKTSAQLTLEAAKKHMEELAAAALKDAANDNTEEPEAPTATGVDVVAKENPESDAPAEEAPADDNSGVIPAINLDDPSTWPLEANGGLMRLPGESGKKFSNRKHKHKLWKREQEAIAETRNGDAPETKQYPTGPAVVYNSDEDGQTLPVPEKSAAESAAVFEAAAMGQTDEPTNEAPAEQTDELANETPAEQTDELAQTNPVQEAGESNVEDSSTSGTTEPAVPVEQTVAATETPPTKPTLTIASSNTEDEALANRAQKFYGDTWTAERAEKLTKAFKFLEMAIRIQQKGESESRFNMPMTSAIRLETEALGISVATAKAA